MGTPDRENHGEIDLLFNTDDRRDDNEKLDAEKLPQPPEPVVKWTQLTMEHLCHNPMCINLECLLGYCQECHLRYDAPMHKPNAARTRLRRLEEAGQGRLAFLI